MKYIHYLRNLFKWNKKPNKIIKLIMVRKRVKMTLLYFCIIQQYICDKLHVIVDNVQLIQDNVHAKFKS